MVDIGTLVKIDTQIAAGGVPRLPFGRGLLITADDLLPASGNGKVRLFETLKEAVDLFAADSDALAAARVWFGADPAPQDLYIGRWAHVVVNTKLRGGEPAAASTLAATNSTFMIGDTVTITTDLSTAMTYAAIAAAIETQIQAAAGIYGGADFDYEDGIFVLTLGGADALPAEFFSNTSVGTDTDIAALLGMDEDSNPSYLPGSVAESAEGAIAAMTGIALGGKPVGLMLAADAPLTDPTTSEDTRAELAAYAQANDLVFALLDVADQALISNDTTSESALAYSRIAGPRARGLLQGRRVPRHRGDREPVRAEP